MLVCEDHGRFSEYLHHSLMMSKNKMEVSEKILKLTLEIIFLLTGEDFVLKKKQNEQSIDDCQLCLSEGSTKDQSLSEEPPCQSPSHEEDTEEETPEPTETTLNTTEEVPVRCEDIAVFFSMDEWEYLEGHKERYKNVVLESPQPPVSADCDQVSAAETADDEGKEMNSIQVDTAPTIADTPVTGGNIPTKPPESCPSPLISQKCMKEDSRMMAQEYQDNPEKGILPPQCKEEDLPVEITSGDQSAMNPPEISGSPVCSLDCIEEENGMTPQKYPAETGDNTLPNWCKEEPDPSKMSSGLPTSWKVQPDSPHLLIPVHHKKGAKPSNPEGSISSDSPPIAVMVKPKTVLNEVPIPKIKTDLPNMFRQKARVDASSSLMKHRGGALNLPPVHESPAAHKCLQCGRSFRNQMDLISHQRTHEKMFHCALCQQSFMDKSALVVHEWTFHIHEPKMGESQPKHTTKEERPFFCVECGKSFMKKSSLVKHQRIHTGAFACPDCGKCLSDKTGLIIHRRTHTGEKPFSCSECGRRFTQMCHLITHQSVHMGKGSFACSDCGKCFSVRSVLEAHQALHNRHKAFTCSDCGKCFLQRSALMAHSKVHTNESDSTY
ncbi:uncharacterized protein LOC142741979 [Rhinoderma darwinii]|uniref:uncharacterized protein LOC142741979 n=1 Tax=Rhinoderma darwinii TaxID=43563 RepID=UPI003F673B6B